MKIINNMASLKNTLFILLMFTFVISWQASSAANTVSKPLVKKGEHDVGKVPMPLQLDTDETVNKALIRFIQIEVVKLTDNSGLTYIGGKVSAADLDSYLRQMKQILGDDFALFRQNQSARDHHSFHMTLINPYEYQTLTKDASIGTNLSVSLLGLARVSVDEKSTYFVVAQSLQAKNYRQNLVLTNKDFHVTLGFNPSDIHGVSKGVASLIK